MPRQHALLSFAVLWVMKNTLLPRRLGACLVWKMALEAAGLAVTETQDVVVVAVAAAVALVAVQFAGPAGALAVAVAVAVGREGTARLVYPPSGMGNTWAGDVALADMLSMVAPSTPRPICLIGAFAFLKRRLAHLIHSFRGHDRWNRGFVLVEAAEILTWAETGMPSSEHCRTPLWPNSDRERSAPDLIFLAVRRARCTRYRGKIVGIAWK